MSILRFCSNDLLHLASKLLWSCFKDHWPFFKSPSHSYLTGCEIWIDLYLIHFILFLPWEFSWNVWQFDTHRNLVDFSHSLKDTSWLKHSPVTPSVFCCLPNPSTTALSEKPTSHNGSLYISLVDLFWCILHVWLSTVVNRNSSLLIVAEIATT